MDRVMVPEWVLSVAALKHARTCEEREWQGQMADTQEPAEMAVQMTRAEA